MVLVSLVLVSDPTYNVEPTCTFSYIILHKVGAIKLNYLKQNSVNFTKILRCEREILILESDS
jgi:hypothetical protein